MIRFLTARRWAWPASVVIAATGGALWGGDLARATPSEHSPYENLTVFARVLAHIEMSWVEEADQDALIYGAIKGMVRSLDPHSSFMTPEEYRVLTSDTQGRFGGVGIEIEAQDGWLTVLGVFDDGPASRAGVKPGDRFLTIAGRDARDMRIQDAVRWMRGEPGTSVQVRLRREGEDAAVDLALVREVIQVEAVEASLLPGNIAYVRIRAFQETTTRELRRALDQAVVEASDAGGVEGLLLDLRNNPGGLLEEAILVSDEFLAEGVIVSTRGRGGQLIAESRANRAGTRPDWPIVVLVNGYSASAAEIVAGALRDHQRAVVVGTRTFGKGSVQNIIELPDRSGLKLTVARYFTPSGRSIQAEGIAPDMEVEQLDPEAYERAVRREVLSEASLEGHLGEEAPVASPVRVARDAIRRRPGEVESTATFRDDYQARMAFQALRALVQTQR